LAAESLYKIAIQRQQRHFSCSRAKLIPGKTPHSSAGEEQLCIAFPGLANGTREESRTGVNAALPFHELGKPFPVLFDLGHVPQSARPFAGRSPIDVAGAGNYRRERLHPPPWPDILQSESSPGPTFGAAQPGPLPDQAKNRVEVLVHAVAISGFLVLRPRVSDFAQF
jgi:hypothetical protein